MKVELTPDAAQWVEAELAAGRFPTAEDAVRYAVNHAKRSILRGSWKPPRPKAVALPPTTCAASRGSISTPLRPAVECRASSIWRQHAATSPR